MYKSDQLFAMLVDKTAAREIPDVRCNRTLVPRDWPWSPLSTIRAKLSSSLSIAHDATGVAHCVMGTPDNRSVEFTQITL